MTVRLAENLGALHTLSASKGQVWHGLWHGRGLIWPDFQLEDCVGCSFLTLVDC